MLIFQTKNPKMSADSLNESLKTISEIHEITENNASLRKSTFQNLQTEFEQV